MKCKVTRCENIATHEAILLTTGRDGSIKRHSAPVCPKHRELFIQSKLKIKGLKNENTRATTEL